MAKCLSGDIPLQTHLLWALAHALLSEAGRFQVLLSHVQTKQVALPVTCRLDVPSPRRRRTATWRPLRHSIYVSAGDVIDREDWSLLIKHPSCCRCRGNSDDVTVIISRRWEAGSLHRLRLKSQIAVVWHDSRAPTGSQAWCEWASREWVCRALASRALKSSCFFLTWFKTVSSSRRDTKGGKRLMHPDGSEAPWLFKNQVGCHVLSFLVCWEAEWSWVATTTTVFFKWFDRLKTRIHM